MGGAQGSWVRGAQAGYRGHAEGVCGECGVHGDMRGEGRVGSRRAGRMQGVREGGARGHARRAEGVHGDMRGARRGRAGGRSACLPKVWVLAAALGWARAMIYRYAEEGRALASRDDG
uniref:Uncharacterized protein n=1 Tax=Muribaculaceae bacterium Z82 TaxID=2304548 RepID=A0A7C9JPV3_9BACT